MRRGYEIEILKKYFWKHPPANVINIMIVRNSSCYKFLIGNREI